jgi:hypothetical protein
MNYIFDVAWERTVKQIVYARVTAVSKEDALKKIQKGQNGVDIYETMDIEILEELEPFKVKIVKNSI